MGKKYKIIRKRPIVRYAGSTIQQNHGELLKGHGISLWDVPKRTFKHIEIPNDYGYYTMDIDNGVVPDAPDMPKKARLRVRVSNTDAVQLKKALTVIHSKYGIKEIAVNRTDRLTERVRGCGGKIDVGDITNSDYQYELIKDYLQRNHIVNDDILLKIKGINDELNGELPTEEVSRNIFWNLKRFEFSNMFSYGENNVIDFTKLNGIVGMFAPNASGKSALLDSLLFCLYDTSSRTFKAERVLNNKKNNFNCKVNFEIDGIDYFIEREAKKLKSGHVKVDVDFSMVDENGDVISLNGDQRRTTNANIRRVIGTYEDFILTSLSLQNNSTVFIDRTQKERKELLAQFMGIGIFDQLYTLSNEKISDVSAILKNFTEEDYERQLADIEKNEKQYKSVQKELKRDKRLLTKKEKELNNEIITLTKKLKSIDESILDIDKLNKNKDKLKGELNDIDVRLGTSVTTKDENEIKFKELQSKIEYYTNHNINKQYLELQQYEEERSNTKIEIDKLKIEVRYKLDKIEKLGNLKYDEDCDYCMSNPFTIDAMKTNEELDKDKLLSFKYVSKIDELDELIDKMKNIRDDKINFDRSLDALKSIEIQQNKLNSDQILLKEKKKNVLHQISIINEKISEYHEKKNDIVYNKQIELEIDKLKDSFDNLTYQIDVLDKKLQTVHAEIKVNQTNKKSILDIIDKVEELEKKYDAYEYYMDSIKRDGVPYELIEKALPTIEGEVNDILSQMVEFGIILEMDGKNINTYIVYDDDNVWPLELSSGMEKFVSSLAIRVGLINVCNLPRSNFLAIDEGWGNLDSENLNTVYMLFQYLKSQFQFIFIVSHIEQMRDTVDILLEINKISGNSKICYG